MFAYQYDDYGYERVENIKEIEMENKGFSFITNFSIDREWYYQQAADAHNLRYAIENDVYSGFGNLISNDGKWMKAFYVDSNFGDLSGFWNTVDDLKKKNAQ